jgi:UDP-N-acetylmuramoylalanine--D-glutamate ligase
VGVLTNVMEDHLNRYDGMDDYARAKELIIAFQRPGDFAVVNADDARVAAMGRRESAIADAPHGSERLWFSVKPLPRGKSGCFVRGGKAVVRASAINDGMETILFPLTAIRIPGAHNIGNVLAACAAAVALRVPLATIRRVVRAFRGVPHRLESIAVKRGVRFVNDTTATAPDASIAALKTFGAKGRKRIVLIAGGADKDLKFDAWAKAVKRHVKHLVLFDGTAGDKIDVALKRARVTVPAMKHKSMRGALAEASAHAKRGDIILLSPGCASFGVFLNEFDRGEQFVRLVQKLR